MARASIYTLLSLDRFFQIMGVNPLHAAGAQAGSYFPLRNRCADLWVQHSWQWADVVSREDLALAIDQAEHDLANKLGWWPAPKWVAQEVHRFPRHHRPDVYRCAGQNVRLQRVSVHTNYGKVIQAGGRATTLIGTATVAGGTLVYSDADGDGFTERATITLPTVLTDAGEIKAYHAGYSAIEEWEIRSPFYKAISSGNIIIRFHTWQTIRPELWEAYPTGLGDVNLQAIDLTGLAATPAITTNLAQSVEVYREYTPTVETSVEFYWEPTPSATLIDGFCTSCNGIGCPACSLTVQEGCLHIRDAERGAVVPEPAIYNSVLGEWSQEDFSECRDPDFVKIWYYSGVMSEQWLRGTDVIDPLPQKWANTIAQMAVARLERPICSCGNVMALSHKYQNDLAAVSSTEKQAQSYNVSPALVQECPFGTRLGEVLAWQAVRNERQRVVRGGAI